MVTSNLVSLLEEKDWDKKKGIKLILIIFLFIFFIVADFGFCAQLNDTQAKRTTMVGTPYWVKQDEIHEFLFKALTRFFFNIDGA